MRNVAVIFFLVIFNGVAGFSQSVRDSSIDNDKLKLLKSYNDQANELYNSFKNGPAFEQLQNYGMLKEKIFNEQKETELKQIESKFNTDYLARQKELSEIKTSISSLKEENDSLVKEKQKLKRNTYLFFIFLIAVLLSVLYYRWRLAKQSQTLADNSIIQSQRTAKVAEISSVIGRGHSDLLFSFRSVFDLSAKAIPSISKLKSVATNQKKNYAELPKIEQQMNRIHGYSESAVISLTSMEHNVKDATEEKSVTNLNKLIDEVFDLSYNWIKSIDDSFECSKAKDLEKILPEISIMPNAIRIALFHFCNNAFYAVYEKKKAVGKSYEPKVTISSRKLPRFIQVRIKDNGIGIDDKISEKIYQPFFSTKTPDIANGLGLTVAAQIIKKKHGGEIIVESEPRTGTDFIIRFPLNNLL